MKKYRSNLMRSDSSHSGPTSSLPSSAGRGDEATTSLVIDDDLMFRDFEVQARGDPERSGMLGKAFTLDNLSHKMRRLLAQVAPLPVRKR